MKKLLFFCSIVLLCLSAKAQINLNDGSWKCVIDERFDEEAPYWEWDTERFMNEGDYSWKSYLSTIAPKGEREIYQFGNCQINTADNTMRLVAYYDSINIHRNNYYLPKWMKRSNRGKGYPSSEGRLYFSGALQYNKKHYVAKEEDRMFQYGYFEIRCKLPTHKGAFPAFWLQNSSDVEGKKFYEEIDIFEYSWWITSPEGPNRNTPGIGSKRCYTCGLYHNDTDNTYRDNSYARTYPTIPSNSTNLDKYHTFGCEWMPDHVIWYFDGIVMNEYHEKDNIPHRPMYLNVNYAIDRYYCHGGSKWTGTDEMVIDYIKVYQKMNPKRKIKARH